MNNKNVPFQVEQLITSMLNTSDDIYIRGNYRARLDEIRDAINESILKFDRETFLQKVDKSKKKTRKA